MHICPSGQTGLLSALIYRQRKEGVPRFRFSDHGGFASRRYVTPIVPTKAVGEIEQHEFGST